MACIRSTLKSASLRTFSATAFNRTTDTNVVKSKPITPLEARHGTSGRSSVSGKTVTVFGATGMMGRIILNRLGKEGNQLVVAYRGDPHDLRPLKLCADLGQMYFQEISIKDPESIRKAMQYSDIVINCIGSDYVTGNFNYEDVHVTAARNIAKMCQETPSVKKLIHFSSLNASLDPQKIYFKNSEFLKTKYLGELAVKSEFEDAVIIRPSNIYGESDRFLFSYIHELRRGLTSIPLWKRGEMTIKMPVHQSNVADGVMKIVHNKDIKGMTYDFVGPQSYLLSEIVDFIFHKIQRPNIKRQFMTPTRLGLTYLTEKIMKRPQFNFDMMEREYISDNVSQDGVNPTLKDLGVEFKDFEQMVGWHLKVFNKMSYYNEKLGEFPESFAPKPLSQDYEFQLRRKIRQSA